MAMAQAVRESQALREPRAGREPTNRHESTHRPAAPAGPVAASRESTAARRTDLRRAAGALPYREGAALLSPRSRPAGPAVDARDAPWVASSGAASTAAFTGLPVSAPVPLDPRDAPLPEEREGARDELQRWTLRASEGVRDLRLRMGAAGGRFADFAGTGARQVRGTVGRAGGLATLLFGPPGRAGAFLAGLVADAAARDPGATVRAGLARDLDAGQRDADALLEARREDHRAALAAPTTEGLSAARDALARDRPAPVPTENELYRDLLLRLVDDAGLELSGDAWNRANLGHHWSSWQFGNPLGLDGQDVADALNGLARVDPGTLKDFQSRRRP